MFNEGSRRLASAAFIAACFAPRLSICECQAVRLAKRLHRANPVTHKRISLRKISTALKDAGHVNTAKYRGAARRHEGSTRGTIKAMVEGPMPP